MNGRRKTEVRRQGAVLSRRLSLTAWKRRIRPGVRVKSGIRGVRLEPGFTRKKRLSVFGDVAIWSSSPSDINRVG